MQRVATGDGLLAASSGLWFLVTVAGQWVFAYYILIVYGGSAAAGKFQKWNAILPHGLSKGDLVGNGAIILHLVLAFVITFGGPIQLLLGFVLVGGLTLVRPLRKYAALFHRWNGRIYIAIAFIISAGALYMTWTQRPVLFGAGPVASAAALTASSLNAALICLFAVMTLRSARAGNTDEHRRWALRTFLMVSGVWFIRIGYGFWAIVTGREPFGGGALGTTANLDGPFDLFLGFARILVPLAVLEIILRLSRWRAGGKKMAALLLLGAACVMAIGIFGAAKILWLPVIRA